MNDYNRRGLCKLSLKVHIIFVTKYPKKICIRSQVNRTAQALYPIQLSYCRHRPHSTVGEARGCKGQSAFRYTHVNGYKKAEHFTRHGWRIADFKWLTTHYGKQHYKAGICARMRTNADECRRATLSSADEPAPCISSESGSVRRTRGKLLSWRRGRIRFFCPRKNT